MQQSIVSVHDTVATRTLFHATKIICQPLARLAVRFGIPYASFAAILKVCFVEAARQECTKDGKTPNDSEIQAATGIRRKSIPEITARDPIQDFEPSTVSRLIGGWLSDEHYVDRQDGIKIPKELPMRAIGPTPSFASLVRDYGQDVGIRPLLSRLQANGNIEVTEYGCVRLINATCPVSQDALETITYVARSVSNLLKTALHNLAVLTAQQEGERRYERRVYSRQIPRTSQAEVSAQLRQVFDRAFTEAGEILARAEVSREQLDLATQGAGFYEFTDEGD